MENVEATKKSHRPARFLKMQDFLKLHDKKAKPKPLERKATKSVNRRDEENMQRKLELGIIAERVYA